MQYIDYLLYLILYFIGAGYSTMKKVADLRKKFPQLDPKTVWATYRAEEWNTMIVSGIGLVLIEITHFIMQLKGVHLTGGIAGSWWFPYAFTIVFAYSGDKLAQKALGSAEEALTRKMDNMPGASSTKTTVQQETPTEVKTVTTTEQTKPKQP